jgi:hypothetical protein
MYIPTLYKIINNYTYIDDSARPVIQYQESLEVKLMTIELNS